MGDEKLTPRERDAVLVAAVLEITPEQALTKYEQEVTQAQYHITAAVQAERAIYEAKLVECAFDDCGHFAIRHDEDGVCDASLEGEMGRMRCPCNVFVPSSDGSGK